MGDKLYHTKPIHDDMCRKLQKEKCGVDRQYNGTLSEQHATSTAWVERNSELQEKIDELNRETAAYSEKVTELKLTVADRDKEVNSLKADLLKIEEKKESASESSDTLRTKLASLESERDHATITTP